MDVKKVRPGKSSSLRNRAEKKFRELETLHPKNLTREQTDHLLHELQVHQIDLEMQNEELRRVQEELEISRTRYFELYDMAPVGYCTMSEKGLILEANLKFANLLCVSKDTLSEQPFSRFILPEDQDIYYRFRQHLLDTERLQACELRLFRTGRELFWGRLEAIENRDMEGKPFYRLVLTDISGRKRLEEEIQNINQSLEEKVKTGVEELRQKDAILR